MATKDTEKKNITGLDSADDRQTAEYNLVESLLAAANYQDESITKIPIVRDGKFLFEVRVHPLSDNDVAQARKRATVYMPNPNNKKMPPVEKEFNASKFTSWIIYLATIPEDQDRIWGNPALMKARNLSQPWEGVGALLKFGEKDWLSDRIYELSGMDEGGEDGETMDDVEFAKNV